MFIGRYVEGLRGGKKTVEIFPCPNCRSQFTLKSNQDVAELPSIFFIRNLLEIMAAQKKAKTTTACSRCQNPAINHCASCEVFMCKKCSGPHDGWFTNHQVLPVEELGNLESQAKMKRKLYCMKHKDKMVEYHCETCKELCCIDCVVLNHQKPKHSCVALSKLAEKLRETLQQSCTTIDEKLSEGKEALNNICEVMKRLEKNAATAKKQIKKQKEKILKTVAGKLDEKERTINEEVDKIYAEMYSELNKQHDEIKEYLDKVQASVSLPRNLLKRGSVEEILSSQKLIDEKIEKLGNEEPEDIVAVNDGSIQYIPADIGMINVDEIVGKMGHVKGMLNCLTVDIISNHSNFSATLLLTMFGVPQKL